MKRSYQEVLRAKGVEVTHIPDRGADQDHAEEAIRDLGLDPYPEVNPDRDLAQSQDREVGLDQDQDQVGLVVDQEEIDPSRDRLHQKGELVPEVEPVNLIPGIHLI